MTSRCASGCSGLSSSSCSLGSTDEPSGDIAVRCSCSRVTFIGAVAQMRHPYRRFHLMLLLTGINKKMTAALYDALTEYATYSTTAPSSHVTRMTKQSMTVQSTRGDPAMVASCLCDARGHRGPDRCAARRRRAPPGPSQPSPSRAYHRGGGSARRGRAAHGDRIDQEPEGDLLRRRRLDPARAGVDRNDRTRDAGRRLQRRAEGQRPPLEPL